MDDDFNYLRVYILMGGKLNMKESRLLWIEKYRTVLQIAGKISKIRKRRPRHSLVATIGCKIF